MIETKSQIDQFILLNSKTIEELQIICSTLALDTDGKRSDLIERLSATSGIVAQEIHPQVIPLRTRGNYGELEGAHEALLQWRKLIFQAKDNTREFGLLNGDGKPYSIPMRYIECSIEIFNTIFSKQWYLLNNNQKDLISLLKRDPTRFELNLVQKPGRNGRSWVMLHIARKAA